ncbi:hypothetical protein [Treponema parvum]|nr:hypothetical protein [Treponema parvum]QTQ16750.1 hypothetical protein HXT04_08635 [Treponema parvum]
MSSSSSVKLNGIFDPSSRYSALGNDFHILAPEIILQCFLADFHPELSR